MSNANRRIVDVEKEVSVDLPAAAANVNSASIDLGENPDQIENVEVEIEVEATDTLVETKDIDIHLEDSADDVTFADIEEFANPVLKVTGESGDVSSLTKIQVRLPRSVNRYIRMNVAVETGGGDVTDQDAHLRLLF